MSVDTLFITDLHGDVNALRRAVELAEESASIRYVILGGDLAPNLITVQLLDGRFVLRHESSYCRKVAEDFRRRLAERHDYRPEDNHGKYAITHSIDLDAKTFLALDDSDVESLLRKPSSFDFLREQQIQFLSLELLPLLRRYGSSGKKVFVMLGNDDFVELEEILLAEEQYGNLFYIHEQVHPLGRSQILGYSCVLSKPFRYRVWERSEDHIAKTLASLTAGLKTEEIVLSIHMPPHGTNLDMLEEGSQHIGSRAVRELLEERPFAIGLFGHVHEAFLVSGSRHDYIGETPVLNPGGYHNSSCCAILLDSSKPRNWKGLWSQN
jgi:Icc-related predicted phosphoesterase